MSQKVHAAVLLSIILPLGLSGCIQPVEGPVSTTHVYYVAAEEVEWDYSTSSAAAWASPLPVQR